MQTINERPMWVVVKVMVPFWIPSILRHQIFRVPKEGHKDPVFKVGIAVVSSMLCKHSCVYLAAKGDNTCDSYLSSIFLHPKGGYNLTPY